MPWIEFHITTTAQHADEISHQLTDLGAHAITFKDAGDVPIYEPSSTTPRVWPETIVISLFDQDHPLKPITDYLTHQQTNGLLKHFSIEHIADEDWVRRSLDSFTPLCFGKRLWICPTWHTPPDSNAINITLDPGLAFGTGTHPTTALCLEWLDEHVTQQALAIDYGCGSGILGIAAQKLGVKRIIAVDNDPQALIATHQNAEQNGLYPPVFTAQLSDEPLQEQADLMIANILAQPLISLANTLASLTKSHGNIVLSGILMEQADAVSKAYEPWFDMQPPVFKEEWARLVGVKR